jgi:hypothetical protein
MHTTRHGNKSTLDLKLFETTQQARRKSRDYEDKLSVRLRKGNQNEESFFSLHTAYNLNLTKTNLNNRRYILQKSRDVRHRN